MNVSNFQKQRTWCELSEAALKNNVYRISQFIPENIRKIAVVKADGYGHGATWIAKIALKNGFTDLAVATLEEAINLREASINVPILLLSPFQPGTAKYLIEFDITQTISSEYEAENLLTEIRAMKQPLPVKIHFKVDTGMNRIGFPILDLTTNDNINRIAKYAQNKIFIPNGIFTHFAAADEPENEFTKLQLQRFQFVIEELEKKNIKFEIKHSANSAATIVFPTTHLDAVRIGIIMYGCSPNKEIKQRLELEPVMSMFSRISSIHTTPKETTVGYNCTYRCPANSRIATIEAGYADGIKRHLSNKGYFLINGEKAPIVGNVCMDRLMLDITNLENVQVGDEVLIFGKDKQGHVLDLDQQAKLAGTISYEILCGISKRVPKIYV